MQKALHLLFFAWALLTAAPGVRAAVPESEVRAAIIVNFSHFVEWPDNPIATSDLHICVAGQGMTADALLSLNGKLLYGRRILVEGRPYSAPASLCRILYIGDTSNRSPLEWLRDAATQPILTVSEGDDFLPNGGIISLNRVGSRVTFDVNLMAMRRSGLKIGSQLLRLARDVQGK